MATAFIKAATNELTCPVCLLLFVEPRNPKDLPECGHVCCELCLRELVVEGEAVIKCPECRKNIKLPPGGAASFKTNFRLRNLASNHPGDQIESEIEPICTEHDDAKMRYFCVPCKSLGCQTCMLLNHKGSDHNCRRITEQFKEQKEEMESIIEETKEHIDTWKIESRVLQKLKETIEDNITNQKEQIDTRADILCNRILRQSKDLKKCVQKAGQERLKWLEKRLKEMTHQVKVAENATAGAVHNLENRSESDCVQEYDALAKKLITINAQMQSLEVVNQSKHIVKFVPGQDGAVGILGKVVQLVEEFGSFRLVQDVACSSDGSLIVCDLLGKKVVVYRREADCYKEKLSVELRQKASGPRGACFINSGHILVARCSAIEKYSYEGKLIALYETGVREDGFNVWSLTTTKDGKILAGDVCRSVVTEHDPSGQVTRTVKTQIKPFCISYVRDNQVAMADHTINVVIVLHLETGNETLRIHIPCVRGVCYDDQSDTLLITRNEKSDDGRVKFNAGVIEQYCLTTGRLIACLAQGLYEPHGLTFTHDGTLAVADYKTIKIYRIT